MPALDRNGKITCGDCGTAVTKKHLSRHKLSCSGGTLYCPKCPNFSTKTRDDLNYHIAKQHSAAGPSKYTSVNCVTHNFLAFMLYVKTKIFKMEHKLGLERAILMWRT